MPRHLIGLVILAVAVPAEAQEWMTRPEIRQVRAVYSQVRAALGDSALRESIRHFEYCPQDYIKRALYQDSTGAGRLFIVEGGGDDHVLEASYYYDAEQVLRFMLVELRAVNGTVQEQRIYFGSDGLQLYHDRRVLAGPGYMWYTPRVVPDPVVAFARPSECPERG